MGTGDRKPLFVRLPADQAHQVDARARTLGKTKQDVVSELLAVSMDDRLGQSPSPGDPVHDDILSLAGLSAWLMLTEESVRARADKGEIPGRCFDDEWRFSRAAILLWLEGSDGSQRSPTGFAGRRPDSAPSCDADL